MRSSPTVTLALSLLALAGAFAAEPTLRGSRSQAAQALLTSLDDEQRAAAAIPFEGDERRNWHFFPREYEGARLGDLEDAGRAGVRDLMATCLSGDGLAKVTEIRALEKVLFERESHPDRPATHRDPDRYWVAVFGEPADDAPWGWRVQGHHISLNFTVLPGERVAHSPFFLGAAPRVAETSEPGVTLEVLQREVRAARGLLDALDDRQRTQALRAEGRPRDVIMFPGRELGLGAPQGLAGRDMTAEQRASLRALIDCWIDNLADDLAAAERARLEAAGLEDVHFLWIGDPRPDCPQYFRVHGPHFAIEYATTADDPNHVHTVWRDLEHDFGGDLLREHLEAAHGDR